MPTYRSRTTTHGRNMAGARALWRATGMKDGDFDKPIIAVVNSFTQFVPGHVHLKDLGQLVARERAEGRERHLARGAALDSDKERAILLRTAAPNLSSLLLRGYGKVTTQAVWAFRVILALTSY